MTLKGDSSPGIAEAGAFHIVNESVFAHSFAHTFEVIKGNQQKPHNNPNICKSVNYETILLSRKPLS